MSSPATPRRFLLIILLLSGFALTGCTAPQVAGNGTPSPQPEVRVVTETVYVPVYIEAQPQPGGELTPPLNPSTEHATVSDDREQTFSLLTEMTRTLSASTDDLKREHTTAQASFNRDRTLINRLRLAWLSVLLGPAAGDDARLQSLLEPLLSKAGGLPIAHPLRPIAETLQVQLNERIRQVREEQKKAEALQQKLDALKALEKQLLERERRRP